MPGNTNTHKSYQDYSITPNEKKEIDLQVEFEMHEAQCKMIKVGGITNVVMGLFIVWVFYTQINSLFLIGWYSTLFLLMALT